MSNPYADPPDEPTVTGVVRVENDALVCKADADLRKYCAHTGEKLWAAAPGGPLSILYFFGVYFGDYARWLPVLRVAVVVVYITLAACLDFGIASAFVTAMSIAHWLLALPASRKLAFTQAATNRPPIWLRRACFLAMFPAITQVSALGIVWFQSGVTFPWGVLSAVAIANCIFVIAAVVGEWQMPKIYVAVLPGDLLKIEGLPEKFVENIRNELARGANESVVVAQLVSPQPADSQTK